MGEGAGSRGGGERKGTSIKIKAAKADGQSREELIKVRIEIAPVLFSLSRSEM